MLRVGSILDASRQARGPTRGDRDRGADRGAIAGAPGTTDGQAVHERPTPVTTSRNADPSVPAMWISPSTSDTAQIAPRSVTGFHRICSTHDRIYRAVDFDSMVAWRSFSPQLTTTTTITTETGGRQRRQRLIPSVPPWQRIDGDEGGGRVGADAAHQWRVEWLDHAPDL